MNLSEIRRGVKNFENFVGDVAALAPEVTGLTIGTLTGFLRGSSGVVGVSSVLVDAAAYASLNAAVSAIGSASATIIIIGAISLTISLTIPVNISLLVLKGGMITIPTTKTLTVTGTVEAGSYKIFSSPDNRPVDWSPYSLQEKVNAAWFGAIGDNSTDNSLPFKQFLHALWRSTGVSSGVRGYIPNGRFNYATGIVLADGVTDYLYGMYIEGASCGQWTASNDPSASDVRFTRLHYTGSGTGLQLGDTTDNLATGSTAHSVTMKNIWMSGTSSANIGLRVRPSGCSFDNLMFSGFTKSGGMAVREEGLTSDWQNCVFTNNYYGKVTWGNVISHRHCSFLVNVRGALAYGSGVSFKDGLFQSNDDYGVAVDLTVYDKETYGTIIEGNYFEDNGSVDGDGQIFLRGSANYEVEDTYIEKNTFSGSGATTVEDIVISTNVGVVHQRKNNWLDRTNGLLDVASAAVGLNYETSAKNTNFTITASYDQDYIFTNSGATTGIIFTLPSANIPGLTLHFAKLANQNITLQCAGTDVINGGTAGKKYVNTSAEANIATLTIRCMLSGYWQVVNEKGTWVNDNT